MSHWTSLWGSRVRLWLPALVFLLVNLGLFLGYRLVLQVRAGAQTQAVVRVEGELEALRTEREAMEAALELAERTGTEIAEVREGRFGTQAERLTRMMLEIKELARRSRLDGPSDIRYSDESIEEFGFVEKKINFSVSGDYESVRQLINLIELSESFLVLEEIAVDESDPGRLRINVTLSTLFEEGETS